MEFYDITEDVYPHPGEYILYVPSQAIVLCGAYTGERIKALHNGKILEDRVENGKVLKDRVENFKKIKIGKKERKAKFVSKCKACGS